ETGIGGGGKHDDALRESGAQLPDHRREGQQIARARAVEPHARVTVCRWKRTVAIEAQALQNSAPRLSVEAQKGEGNPEQQVAGDHVGEPHSWLDYHPGPKRDSSSPTRLVHGAASSATDQSGLTPTPLSPTPRPRPVALSQPPP